MLVQLPALDDAESIEAWTADVAKRTETDEAVVRAIAEQVEDRDQSATTPWDTESSGRTYDWPRNEHEDF